MPYYIYKISPVPGSMVKKLDLQNSHENFREAKHQVRELRAEAGDDDSYWKVVFAESELQAEELLQEKREAPILMEWEK